MMKKAFAALAVLATAAMGFVGFAPQSSAQTIGACANPEVCGFINASGFTILGFANGTFGFIDTGFPFLGGSPSVNQLSEPNQASAASVPAPTPASKLTSSLGQWGLGSLPVGTASGVPTGIPSFANLGNLQLAQNTAADTDGGLDLATVAPVATGLVGLYGALMVAVRRRAATVRA